jgi:serine/threonine-protein kinase
MVSDPADLIGKRIDKYEIVRLLGRGGMGAVYEAVHETIGKRVAMKFIDARIAADAGAVARFHREAQAASAIQSAHIIEIFDSGTTQDGLPYLVMELLRGEDLGHLVKRCGRLSLRETVDIVSQVLRGLERAHEAGIVHRDLKPDNVFLLERDGATLAKILDFGISKIQPGSEVPTQTLTREGTVVGTPYYMSPEQALGRSDVDHRTDLWAVGAILFECLTGRPPHLGKTYEEVIVGICSVDATDVRDHDASVPEPVADVVATALARNRDDRYASARDFFDALLAATGGSPMSTRPAASSRPRAWSPAIAPPTETVAGRVERGWFGIALAVLAAGALAGYLFYRYFLLQHFR